jgi:multiple sugar transport system ATP-binding protein
MASVSLVDIEKRFGAHVVIPKLNVEIADGSFVVLVGPSGCGKTTTLNMIAGLEPITAGTVSVDGRVINQVPAKDRDIAMVFQTYALYPHMDVYNNLAFGLRRRSVPAAEIDRRVRSVAGRLGLAAFLARKPHALSGGQRQRVALGRAIVRDPKVFLFDEPLSNLDAALRVTTRNELIRQQHEIGITTIYVTHDQVEAMTMGHRICIMDKGEVVQIGPPLEVYRNPVNTFVARFLGNPPMNLAAVRPAFGGDAPTLRLGDVALPLAFWSGDALARHRDGSILLGIRPEDLYETSPRPGDERLVPVAMRVLAVEPLGAETLLVLALDGSAEEIIARIGRETRLRPDDRATLLLDAAAIQLFDAATTRVIARDRA